MKIMQISVKMVLVATLTIFLAGYLPAPAAAQQTLKISHQFPGSSGTTGDFRDRLCHKFAEEVEKSTNGALKFQIYPSSSLMKTEAQWDALTVGALDLSLLATAYWGGEIPELNITWMPGIVTSYEQGAAWKNAEIGKALSELLAQKGVVIVSWLWQEGGVASRPKPVIKPEDCQGLKIRGGSREFDIILKAAGASLTSLPSNDLYVAMQTGALDAAMTSSTSLMSFRLEEVSKFLALGRHKSFWFVFEPVVMSKIVFERLPKEQQAIIMKVGAEMEKFGREWAQADDNAVAEVYQKAGAKVFDLDDATVKEWRELSRRTAWKDFQGMSANCARFLELAEKVQP
jgi:TRAP-type C4-dicarboxylate transport system substrate-binding protein